MTLNWKIQKISLIAVLVAVACECVFPVTGKRSLSEFIQQEEFTDEQAWPGEPPVEIDAVSIQILDKISGKVFRGKVRKDVAACFGSLQLLVKRCFKNNPEEKKEVYAFVEISENGKVIFNNWLFASSPTINLLAHPMYDVRVEF